MSRVARVSCPAYRDAHEAFVRALGLLDRGGLAMRGEAVLLKPNLLAAHPPVAAVTTHPAVLEAALAVARDLGARPVVGDSPGLGSIERVAAVAGCLEVCRRFGAPLVDLGAERAGPPVSRAGVELAREAVEARWLWNLPKWKTHAMTGLTLGVKNLFGCVPGKRKVAVHFRAGRDAAVFARLLCDLCDALSPTLTVLDGVVAMEGAGPSRGHPLARGLVLASADPHALDWEAARLSGFAPQDVPTLACALAAGRIAPQDINVVGDPAEPMRFRRAPGSPCDWPLPRALKWLARRALPPAPGFEPGRCTGCGVCTESCPAGALKPGTPPELSQAACIRCYCCHELCPSGAVRLPFRRFPGFRFFRGRSLR